MKFDRLALFDLVIRSGSFAAAARRIDLDPSSVSRTIAALEADLGVRLIARNTRHMRPTPAGERLRADIGPHLMALDQAASRISGEHGIIRLTASTTFSRICLMPSLAEFRREHPEVKLELRATDRAIDLVDERIDIAIRHGKLADSALLARKIRDVEYWCVGRPEFADVSTIDDLAHLPHLVFDLPKFRDEWIVSQGRSRQSFKTRPALMSDNADALFSAAQAGMGIALLADWTVRDSLARGELIRILPDYKFKGPVENAALWMVTPTRAGRPKRVDEIMGLLKRRLGQ